MEADSKTKNKMIQEWAKEKPESTKIQTTLNVEAHRRVKALAKVTGKSDSEVVNYITQSWMVDNFDKEYDFWAAKIPEQK